MDSSDSGSVKIKKWVRQGYILSSMLFNVYAEYIFLEAIEEINKDVKINGKYVNDIIRHADDSALLAYIFNDKKCFKSKYTSMSKNETIHPQLMLISAEYYSTCKEYHISWLCRELGGVTIRSHIEQAPTTNYLFKSLPSSIK